MAWVKGQGAIELASPTAGTLVGQGATEYLVLLAVVLIVALVSVALLGFFPRMASDAQVTQSKAYWSSASPVAIVEIKIADSQVAGQEQYAMITSFKVKNNGGYAVRVTRLLGEGAQANRTSNGPSTVFTPISLYLAPGEENWIVYNGPGLFNQYIGLSTGGNNDFYMKASQPCDTSRAAADGATATIKDFGFEYIEYVEGQQITKREIGKPLIVKCVASYYF